MKKPTGPIVLLASAAWLAGCASAAFNPSFPDNRTSQVDQALKKQGSRALRPSNATGKPLVFVVTPKPTQLIAYDLQARRTLWKQRSAVTSRVLPGRDMVFHRGGNGGIVGRSVLTGQIVWQNAPRPGERLLGMATVGDRLFYTTETIKRVGDEPAAHLVAVDGRSGSIRWVRPSSGRLGAPAARGAMVFVPLRSQSIAAIDAETGEETARVRSSEETLLWARSEPGGVLFGGTTGVYRFDRRAVTGTQEGSNFISAGLPESVRPVYWWNGYNAALAGYTAYDRNRLLWRVGRRQSSNAPLQFLNQRLFVHNYRFFFAFDTSEKKAKLQWAFNYPRHDVVAATYTGRGLVLVTEHGHIVILDAQRGRPAGEEIDLGLQVRGASFDADGLAPVGEPQGEPNLRAALKEVIWDPDRRFEAVKLFAVEQMGELPGPEVTEELVKVVIKEGITRPVYKRAGDMIVARHDKDAIPLYLRTLKSHYSFVEGTESQAVSVMARALGDLKAPEAVQPLLDHLADHETPLDALVEIVKALVAIGDKSVVEPFRDVLLTYRCDPLFGQQRAQGVLNLIAEALLKMGGQDERQLLSFVENDVHTLPALRNYIGKALRQEAPARTARQTAR